MYVAVAVAAVALLGVVFAVMRLGQDLASRQRLLKSAVQIELELVLADLRFEEWSRHEGAYFTTVQQHLSKADWYGAQINDICSNAHGILWSGNETDLCADVRALRSRMSQFRPRLAALESQESENSAAAGVDPNIDRTFTQLTLAAKQIRNSAEELIHVQQAVFHGLQTALVVGSILIAGFFATTLHRYLVRRTQVETALRESEEKFRSVFEMSNDAVMLLDDKRFIDCNMATLRTFQVDTKEEFCRKHPADLSPPRQPDGSDSMESANERIATALREGSCRFEWMHMRDDGSEMPAEVVLSRVHVEGRNVLQAVVRDVTQRKLDEEQLRATKRSFARSAKRRSTRSS